MLALQHKIENFCQTVIKKRIDDGGLLFNKPETGIVLFYAGPSDKVLEKIPEAKMEWGAFKYPQNWQLSEKEAERLKAHRIDDSPLFLFLMSKDFEKDFSKFLGIDSDSEDFEHALKKVWHFTSAHFASKKFKKAATLVCGAEKKSSFYAAEMFGILDNPCVEVINEKPASLFLAFRPLGKDEVNRLMCVTALMEMRKHAKASNDNKAWDNYKRQRKYFILSRQAEKRTFSKQPKDVKKAFRQSRKEILTHFNKDKENNLIAPKRRVPIPTSAPSF